MPIDIVFPNQNEREFIEMAGKLEYSELCLVYDTKEKFPKVHELEKLRKDYKIGIYTGFLATHKNLSRHQADLVLVKSSLKDRIILESKGADIIFNMEHGSGRDFIYSRNSGLTHVLSRLASKNNVMAGFSFSLLLNSENRSLIMGRVMQNIRFCRKYKIKTVIASFASSPYEMRSWHDLMSLFVSLGMHPKEARDSFENALLTIKENSRV